MYVLFSSLGPNSWDFPHYQEPATIKPKFWKLKNRILRIALFQSMQNLKGKADGVQEKDSLMMIILMIKWKSN